MKYFPNIGEPRIEWVVALVEVETVVEIDVQDSADSALCSLQDSANSQSQKRQDSEDSVDSVQDSTESWLLIVLTEIHVAHVIFE